MWAGGRKIKWHLLVMSLGLAMILILMSGMLRSRVMASQGRQNPITEVAWGGAGAGQKIILAGAKNEYLSLHFRFAGADITSFKAQHTGPAATGISFKFYQVTTAPRGSRQYAADALVPLSERMDNSAEIWVTVRIPANATSGVYNYELMFSDQRASFRQPLEIKVWNFSLAHDLPIAILGNLWVRKDWLERYGVKSQAQYDEAVRAYLRSSREYKFNSVGNYYPFPVNQLVPGKRVEDFPEFDRMTRYVADDLKFRYFRVPKISEGRAIDQFGSRFAERARVFYPLFDDYLRRHNWEQRALIKIIDEPKPALYDTVLKAYGLVKSLAPNIKTESAGSGVDPRLARVVNIWVMYATTFDPVKIAEAERQGQQVWLYANKLHGIDQPLVNQRLIGWYLYQYKFPGYLFWGLDCWPQDPWTTEAGRVDSLRRGTFFYPDPRTGLPLPTTRLEALRQGFQDYQYLALLGQAHQQGRVSKSVFDQISARVQGLTKDLKTLAPHVSMRDLEAVRLQIGEVLDHPGQPR